MFSFVETLFRDPLWFLEYSLYRIPAILISLVLHECAHGYVAYRLGDPTAKEAGRLSLNPLRHLDPVGTLLMFFLGYGWAKPVPVNPRYFKNPHRDDFLVSIAGVTVNLIVFLVATILMAILNSLLWRPEILARYSLHDLIGFKDGAVNTILAGYGAELGEFFKRPGLLWAMRLTSQIAWVNLAIAVFNLLPVPPLDGSHVVNDLFFKGALYARRNVAQIGIAALFLLSFIDLPGTNTSVLGYAMGFVTDGIQGGLLSLIRLVTGA